MYTLEDLSCAKLILQAQRGQVCTDQLWQEYRNWAVKVIGWFNALFNYARCLHRHLNDWQLSIKGTWQVIRKVRRATRRYLVNALASLRKAVLRAKGQRLAPSAPATVQRISFEDKYAQKSRAGKYSFSQRCANIAHSIQSTPKFKLS